eukprot:365808-Chlamydomonas_euryale.AAC.1
MLIATQLVGVPLLHHGPRRRWIDCARATLRELHVLHDGEWYWRAQGRAQWRALVVAVRGSHRRAFWSSECRNEV